MGGGFSARMTPIDINGKCRNPSCQGRRTTITVQISLKYGKAPVDPPSCITIILAVAKSSLWADARFKGPIYVAVLCHTANLVQAQVYDYNHQIHALASRKVGKLGKTGAVARVTRERRRHKKLATLARKDDTGINPTDVPLRPDSSVHSNAEDAADVSRTEPAEVLLRARRTIVKIWKIKACLIEDSKRGWKWSMTNSSNSIVLVFI